METSKNLKVTCYSSNRKQVIERTGKILKKLSKFDVTPPTFTLGDDYIYSYHHSDPENEAATISYEFDVFDLTITFSDTFKFNGWKPVVYFNHKDNVMLQLDLDANYAYDIEQGLKDGKCDHCNTNRYRGETWLLKHEDGAFKQVGTTCVKDFTGVDPSKYFDMFRMVSNEFSTLEEEEGLDECGVRQMSGDDKHKNPENYRVYEIDNLFNISQYIIAVDGEFVKKEYKYIEVPSNSWRGGTYEKKVRANEGEATADKVEQVLRNQQKLAAAENKLAKVGLSEEDETKLAITMGDILTDKYFIGIEETNKSTEYTVGIRKFLSEIEVRQTEYTYNKPILDENGNYQMLQSTTDDRGGEVENYVHEVITEITENPFDLKMKSFSDRLRVRRFDIGALVYGCQMYNTYLVMLTQPQSSHMGIVGEKIEVEATVKSVRSFETRFGMSNVYNMIDAAGNVYVKFGTISVKFITNGDEYIKDNTTLKMLAEVNEHGEFKGIKQTVLGRCSTSKEKKR